MWWRWEGGEEGVGIIGEAGHGRQSQCCVFGSTVRKQTGVMHRWEGRGEYDIGGVVLPSRF